jgi:predicted nucleic acid-binding protein
MAQSIVMNWNFSRASSVIESTLDTHTENGDLVPRYRVSPADHLLNASLSVYQVSNAKSLCSYDIPTHQFSEGQNGATMIHKVQNKNSSQVSHSPKSFRSESLLP